MTCSCEGRKPNPIGAANCGPAAAQEVPEVGKIMVENCVFSRYPPQLHHGKDLKPIL